MPAAGTSVSRCNIAIFHFQPKTDLSIQDADVSPLIYNTPLNPIEQDRCKYSYLTNREAFRKGINRMMMCAGDEALKECPGDTGGPLQVRLLSSSRYTPFVIGVAVLGVPCGQTTPGVYAKMAHYINWIELVTKRNYFPQECVTRHISHREWDESLVPVAVKVYYNEIASIKSDSSLPTRFTLLELLQSPTPNR